jgi:hypothetical protein
MNTQKFTSGSSIPTPEETYKMLNKQKKFKIKIRAEQNNPNYVTERVIINGEAILIPVGQEVEVPQLVKELLENKGVL